MPRRGRRRATTPANAADGDDPTQFVDTVPNGKRQAPRGRQRKRAGSDGSEDSAASASSEEHVRALSALQGLDGVKDALTSALGNIERMERERNAGSGSEGSDMSEVEAEAVSMKHAKSLRLAVIEAVDRGVSEITDVLEGSLNKFACGIKAEVTNVSTAQSEESRAAVKRHRLFGEKVFRARSSMLSSMLRDRDFQTIYNMAVAAMFWLGMRVVMEEFATGAAAPDLGMLMWCFDKLNVVILTWWAMFLTSFTVVWLVQRIKSSGWPFRVWVWPYLALLTAETWGGVAAAMYFNLPLASATIVSVEGVRLTMKIHAYLREKLLHGNGPNEYATFIPHYAKARGCTVKDLRVPDTTIADMQTEIGRFVYFVFCPSLVYRDSYPRSRHIRWKKVLGHFANVFLCLGCTYVMYRAFVAPRFKVAASKSPSLVEFGRSVFYAMVPALGVYIMGFFGLLHSWLNMWSELLRYADRDFYTDWWNARSFGAYYRKWNRVVHEWLLYHLYFDSMRFTKGRIGRTGATVIVFVVSALIHEVVILGAIQFWYPVLLLMFGGPGVLFMIWQGRSEQRLYNIFFWSMLTVGLALLLVLYTREWYARQGTFSYNSIEFANSGFLHYIVPQSWPESWYDNWLMKKMLP